MTANNKISTVFPQQAPFFIREDHPNTVRFLEKYYEYLEQSEENFRSGNPIERLINHLQNIDIDHTDHDEAAQYLYKKFIQDIPLSINADKNILLKNIKDFYRAKGTEKATKFLIYALTGFANTEIYYPKRDILRASDGKWYIQKSLRVYDTEIEGTANTLLSGLEQYIGRQIRGNTSNSSAIVESIDRFFQQGSRIDELILSNINGDFENGEVVYATFEENGMTKDIESKVFGGIVNSITIDTAGTGYEIGDPVVIISSSGAGACATVASVSTGNISSLAIINGGAGFKANDSVTVTPISGGGGASIYISSVDTSEEYHPNSYNLIAATIGLESNTLIGNTTYSNLVPAITDPANNTIANSMLYFNYANTGPISGITILSTGSGYDQPPVIDAVANNLVKTYGILGRMRIVDGGLNYSIGDTISFIGGAGLGATANVSNVAANGKITQVRFQTVTGFPIGGVGYTQDNLPTCNVETASGNGANIVVTAILGDGEEFMMANTTLGAIERITIFDSGFGYTEAPTIDLTGSGDGTARANATIIEGVFEYPGRYLNDDGFISSYNFLQDRDYYQLFSYVIQSGISIDDYRAVLMKLGHPAGMKMFGEYRLFDPNEEMVESDDASNISSFIIYTKEYNKTGNSINIAYTSHGIANGTNVYLEFKTGDMANVENSIYSIININPNSLLVVANNSNNTSGNVEIGIPRS